MIEYAHSSPYKYGLAPQIYSNFILLSHVNQLIVSLKLKTKNNKIIQNQNINNRGIVCNFKVTNLITLQKDSDSHSAARKNKARFYNRKERTNEYEYNGLLYLSALSRYQYYPYMDKFSRMHFVWNSMTRKMDMWGWLLIIPPGRVYCPYGISKYDAAKENVNAKPTTDSGAENSDGSWRVAVGTRGIQRDRDHLEIKRFEIPRTKFRFDTKSVPPDPNKLVPESQHARFTKQRWGGGNGGCKREEEKEEQHPKHFS